MIRESGDGGEKEGGRRHTDGWREREGGDIEMGGERGREGGERVRRRTDSEREGGEREGGREEREKRGPVTRCDLQISEQREFLRAKRATGGS